MHSTTRRPFSAVADVGPLLVPVWLRRRTDAARRLTLAGALSAGSAEPRLEWVRLTLPGGAYLSELGSSQETKVKE